MIILNPKKAIEFKMKAWQIDQYGNVAVLQLKNLADPTPKNGWILIEVKAFGINRSELFTRQGHSGDAVTLPRVLGIECVGVVRDGGNTDLKPGQKVAAAMGNMGRLFDGGYAESTLIPRDFVYPIETSLEWEAFGAIPEMYLTAWGATMEAIQLKPDDTLLIRGGTSSVGLACASIAKAIGAKVISTTRSDTKAAILKQAGVDHVVIDQGQIAEHVKTICPNGVNGVVELVGIEHTIKDCLACTAPKGTVCMVGFLGNSWNYQFFPWMPSTVKLTCYNSETLHAKYATPVLQNMVKQVENGQYLPHIDQVYAFKDLPLAHQKMEQNQAAGKLVVRVM